MTKKKSVAQRPAAKPRLKKAVPPPDNPLLRHEAQEVALGGGADEVQMARARARAIQQTQEMPVADTTETTDEPPTANDDDR